jgi:phenylacetate-CoA ligase
MTQPGQETIWDPEVETRAIAEVEREASALLARQLEDVVGRSLFYADKFSDAGADPAGIDDVRDLGSLPLTTKAEVKRAQDRTLPFGPHLGVQESEIAKVFQTSGSTGSPSLLAVTAGDLQTWRTIGNRSYFAAGVRPSGSVLITFGAGPFVAGHTHAMLEMTGCRVVPVSPGDTERSLRSIELGIVDTFLGTPTFAMHLANLIGERGMSGMSLKHLVTGGEPGGGLPETRSQIESAFNGEVREVMGIGDVSPSLFGECEAQDGMHFCGQGLVWPELIDPDSDAPLAIEGGAFGELVYTALAREAMPLIRFRSGDLVHITDTECPCGRTSFKIRCVGRTDDMFIVRGVNVYPSAISDIAAEFRSRLTGRARAVIPANSGVSVPPPIRVEVEVPEGSSPTSELAGQVAARILSKLIFRADVVFVPQSEFGEAGYKTRPIAKQQEADPS